MSRSFSLRFIYTAGNFLTDNVFVTPEEFGPGVIAPAIVVTTGVLRPISQLCPGGRASRARTQGVWLARRISATRLCDYRRCRQEWNFQNILDCCFASKCRCPQW